MDCTRAAPLWSAEVDPCVLSVFVRPAMPGHGVDLLQFGSRILSNRDGEHVHLVIGGESFRLDVVGGTLAAGPVNLEYRIAQDHRLARQLETVRRLDARLAGLAVKEREATGWMRRRATALRVWDARVAGASLREIAVMLWGPGEWPGPGDCHKSAARRFVTMGERLIAEGPWPVLAG